MIIHSASPIHFSVIEGRWAVVRMSPGDPIPEWVLKNRDFTSITRTHEELSIVCSEEAAPVGGQVEKGWSLLKLHGPFPFDQVGVLASFTQPLADAGIGIFAMSTFDTDYILVKESSLNLARAALCSAGHELVSP